MSCPIHQAFESGDDTAFARAVGTASWDELSTIYLPHERGDPCTFCDTIRAAIDWQINDC